MDTTLRQLLQELINLAQENQLLRAENSKLKHVPNHDKGANNAQTAN